MLDLPLVDQERGRYLYIEVLADLLVGLVAVELVERDLRINTTSQNRKSSTKTAKILDTSTPCRSRKCATRNSAVAVLF